MQPKPPSPVVEGVPNPGTVQITDWNIGSGVNGFLSDLSPTARLAGYPTAIQESWPTQNEGFAGLINLLVISGPGTGTTFAAYCIDLLTNTWGGIQYKPGEWTEANVPNVGFVAQLLQSYYPTTNEPSGVDENTKAAAVQAAIWYFSDGFVVAPGNAFHDLVAGIVADVLHKGPLTAPPPPTVTIDGPAFGLANEVVGPFTVHTNGEEADGRVPAGVSAFSDAGGAHDLGSTFTITDGQQLWLRGAKAGAISLTVTATVTQPGGVVYLSVPTPGGNQTIIQAGPATSPPT